MFVEGSHSELSYQQVRIMIRSEYLYKGIDVKDVDHLSQGITNERVNVAGAMRVATANELKFQRS